MAKSALPLILGVAAAALILGKKGKGSSPPTSTQLVVLEPGDTLTEADALFDRAVYDRVCIVAVVIDGMSAAMATEIVAKAALTHPKTFFYVSPDNATINQMGAWFENPPVEVPSGFIGVAYGASLEDLSESVFVRNGTALADAETLILQGIDLVLSPSLQGGIGNRGLSGYATQTASSTITPLRANRSGSNRGLFRAIAESAKS